MELVGKRVSVRFREPDGVRDAVGRVLRADATGLLVERRDGRLAQVRAGTVLFLRVVPDRPLRRRPAATIGVEELSRIAARGWPAVESVPLGAWELRASGGFTRRANCAAVHGDPATADPIAAVTDFYRARDLPPLAQLTAESPWEARFEAAGWSAADEPATLVQTADLTDPPTPDRQIALIDRADDAWLARYGRGEPNAARAVVDATPTVGFVSMPGAAIARVVVTGEWAGLTALEVDPAHRRRGLGRRIVQTCLAWAAERGADKACLQVGEDNDAARALYARYGFTTHHAYRYFAPRPAG